MRNYITNVIGITITGLLLCITLSKIDIPDFIPLLGLSFSRSTTIFLIGILFIEIVIALFINLIKYISKSNNDKTSEKETTNNLKKD